MNLGRRFDSLEGLFVGEFRCFLFLSLIPGTRLHHDRIAQDLEVGSHFRKSRKGFACIFIVHDGLLPYHSRSPRKPPSQHDVHSLEGGVSCEGSWCIAYITSAFLPLIQWEFLGGMIFMSSSATKCRNPMGVRFEIQRSSSGGAGGEMLLLFLDDR